MILVLLEEFIFNEMSGIDKAFIDIQEGKKKKLTSAFLKPIWIFIGRKKANLEEIVKEQIKKIKRKAEIRI